jgi:ADP-dependent phosphofructokinase/glucokinase
MTMDLKQTWKAHYANSPRQLERMRQVGGVASVFNANIDAVLKVKAEQISGWIAQLGLESAALLAEGPKRIVTAADVLRGFIECFKGGIAQEWLVTDETAFQWMRDHVGYERLQMGGQGGIIANVMAVAGVKQVYVHCASLPAQQAGLFLKQDNLVSTDAAHALKPAHAIDRPGDLPLIHWILEFDKGAQISVGGQVLTCPKSNRFIATYDPLNFVLHVEEGLDKALGVASNPLDVILLSGYQMLSAQLQGGAPGSGLQRISESWAQVLAWKAAHPRALIHFEFASTQDLAVRRALAQELAPYADSVGCNEQELIGMLEVLGEDTLARQAQALDSVSLFKGLEAVFRKLKLKRLQLHMFGLYVTLIRPGVEKDGPAFQSEANRDGMAFAATIAAAKAGTGSIEKAENLLWAHGREVADQSLKELQALDSFIADSYGQPGLAERGIVETPGFTLVAVPTILIDKPVTLVGMGDTISSLSLVGAR